MDPISIIGLLASLSTLIESGHKVYNLIETFKNSFREASDLAVTVTVFNEALKGFDRVLRSRQTIHRISPTVIKHALENSKDTIQSIETRLIQLSAHNKAAVRKMIWVKQKSEFNKLLERLKEQISILQTFLELTHYETFLAVVSQHPQFAVLVSSLDAEGPPTQDSSPDFAARRLSNSDANSLSTVETRSSLDSLSLINSGSSVSSYQSHDEIYDNVSESSSTQKLLAKTSTRPILSSQESSRSQLGYSSESIDQDSSQSMVVIHKACRYDCYCKCHEEEPRSSQRRFSKIKRAKTQCTELSCKNATVEESHSVYSSSFRGAISQIMSSKSIKVRYNLNTFRMVPEGSDSVRFVKHGNLEALKASFNAGEATIWDTSPDGWSLLHTAIYGRQLPTVKYLLDMGAETDVSDLACRTPGDLALFKSLGSDVTDVERGIFDLFSEKNDSISDFDFTPIHTAVLGIYDAADKERPSLEQLISLLDDANNAKIGTNWTKWKLEYRNRSPLFGNILEYFRSSAFETGNKSKIIHQLLDRKDKKNFWSPLHWAAFAGQVEKMKILLKHGADPFVLSNLDFNIIHSAVESKLGDGLAGALEIWKLYPQKLDINQRNTWGETALHMAAFSSEASVRLLLEAGADVDVQQEDGQVPLHSVGLSGQSSADKQKIVSLLCSVQSMKHVNIQDNEGRSPVFEYLDETECIETIVQHGARLDLLDTMGKTVLHYTCIQDKSDTLGTVLRLAAEPTIATATGHDRTTPLMEALVHGSKKCAMLLLNLEDVGETIDNYGWSVAHHAAKNGDSEVLEAVLRHPSFTRGVRTLEGKSLETVAMEASTWSGSVKSLIRKYDTIV